MNLTRSALIEHISICSRLQIATETQVRALQEQETKIQNELIIARQLHYFLDIYAGMCHSEISRIDQEAQDKQT